MTLTLDPALEQRLQQELARRGYADPADFIAHALDVAEAEHAGEATRRAQIVSRLQESIAQARRGETFSPEEVRARLVNQREAHPEFSSAREARSAA